MFPDALFVVPVRHPLTQVYSLVRQHRLFGEYAARDARVPKYLAAAGHYEFGPQRVPIRLSAGTAQRTAAAWRRGEEFRGYAIQWAEAYAHVAWLMEHRPEITRRLIVVRYEDFCADPGRILGRVRRHLQIPPEWPPAAAPLTPIAKSTAAVSNVPAEEQNVVWDETASVARSFGYHDRDSDTPSVM